MRFRPLQLLSALACTAVVAAPLATAQVQPAAPLRPIDLTAAAAPAAKPVTTPLVQRRVPVQPAASSPTLRSMSETVAADRRDAAGTFRMIGVTWAGERTTTATAKIRVRRGGGWTAWQQVDSEAPTAGVRGGTEPIWVGRSLGYQVRIAATGGRLRDVQVALLNPTPVAADRRTSELALAAGTGGLVQRPRLITRKQWGADPRLASSCSSPAASSRLKMAVVHHTAGGNTYTAAQSAGIVRGTYAYHTQSRGWCDIGYNFLVDKYGQIFEARRGGMNIPVRGAHVSSYNDYTVGVSMMGNYDVVGTTPALLESVAKVLAWKLDSNYLDPRGKVQYGSRTLDVITAHRNVGQTACPGRYGYAKMGWIRDRVAQLTGTDVTPVRARWQAAGGAAQLGYVYRGERHTGGGLVADFASGSIYSTAATGARLVTPPLLNRYVAVKQHRGVLGWPTGEQRATPVSGVSTQVFQRGQMWRTSRGVFELYGPLYAEYRRLGRATSDLGVPTSGVRPTAGGSSATFTNGTMSYDAATAKVTVSTAVSQVKLTGAGFGHGRGMSQWGSEGAARQGLSAEQILAFYYPGTARGSATGPVRIHLTGDTSPDLVVRPQAKLRVIDRGDNTGWTLPATPGVDMWRLRYTSANQVILELHDRAGWRRHSVAGRTVFKGAAEFRGGGPVKLVTPSGTRSYRGGLRTADRAGTDMDTVNVLSMNAYLFGVVPRESPPSWQPAALQAQSVAARTYAAFHRARAVASGRDYDLCDTTSCQMYGGVAGEYPSTNAAVGATSGHIRTYRGTPIMAEFSSSNGGQTAGSSVPYQTFQADPYDPWSGNPVRSWTATLSDVQLERAYPSIGDLQGVTVVERDGHGRWGGRATLVRVSGSSGAVTVSGDSFRMRCGLRSTFFTLT